MSIRESSPVEPIEVKSSSCEQLIGLSSNVQVDGQAAVVSVAFTNQRPFNVLVPFSTAGILLHEIRQAAALMTRRQQQLAVDGGAARLLECAEAALRPADIEILIDPCTADRVFIMQFRDHAPLAIRMGPDLVHASLMRLEAVSRRVLN